MKKIIPQLLILIASLGLLIHGSFVPSDDGKYFDLLLSEYVLNIAVVVIGLALGYSIKSYWVIFGGATFALAVYLIMFVSNLFGFFSALFLAVYTVLLLAATVGNLIRNFKDWILVK